MMEEENIYSPYTSRHAWFNYRDFDNYLTPEQRKLQWGEDYDIAEEIRAKANK